MRLKDKVAIVVGAGQRDGETIGNGRATAVLFAREGASVLLVDRDAAAAQATLAAIDAEGGTASIFSADIVEAAASEGFARACMERYGRIDILQNNVGIGTGDGGATTLTEDGWDAIMDTNLKAMWLTCRAVLPHMRAARRGAIVNISSGAAVMCQSGLAYKISKAGVNALTHSVAWTNAKYGIRANTIMPGLLDTPMAIESHLGGRDVTRAALRAERDAAVPLAGGMGSAWDTAYASLFLASDEAKFITGAVLPVDGGQAARVGF